MSRLHNVEAEEDCPADVASITVRNATMAVQRLVDAFPGHILLHQEPSGRVMYVFDDQTGKWTKSRNYAEEAADARLDVMIAAVRDRLRFVKREVDPTTQRTLWRAEDTGHGDSVHLRGVLKMALWIHDSLLVDTQTLARMYARSQDHLLFRDGIYDCRRDTFCPGFDPTILFLHSLPMAYPRAEREDPSPDALRHRVYQTLFESTLGQEIAAFTVRLLGTALCGEPTGKIVWFVGPYYQHAMLRMLRQSLGEHCTTTGYNLLLLQRDKDVKRHFQEQTRPCGSIVEMSMDVILPGIMHVQNLLLHSVEGRAIRRFLDYTKTFGYDRESTLIFTTPQMPNVNHDDLIDDRCVYIPMVRPAPSSSALLLVDETARGGFVAMLLDAYQAWRHDTDVNRYRVPQGCVYPVV